MALTGNRGEWGEPYALLKLLAEGKLYLGGENFSKVEGIVYHIIKLIRHEQGRNIEFTYKDKLIIIKDGDILFEVPIVDFINNTTLCLNKINNAAKGGGSFEIPEIENFLASFNITQLKEKAKQKNDITIQIEDPNTFFCPTLGFSIKSQLGQPATLVNASGATNFTYRIIGEALTDLEIEAMDGRKYFSAKLEFLRSAGAELVFEGVDNQIFKSNLQTVDYHFDKILSEIILMYYSNSNPKANTIANFTSRITEINPSGYDLNINSTMYEMIVKKFLTDYALGMRAAEVWKRDYQATGGYLIVREDGELICYHFYFTKNFEDYLFDNTKLDTPDPDRHKFGKVYLEDGVQKIKLNLQIRFTK